MQKQKGISPIIAVIVLAVILIGGGAYYFKQQAKPVSKSNVIDATANWKTYTNKEGKISIQYPPEWKVTERKGNGNSNSKEVSLEGKEGNVVLDWGSGFGGMCDEKHETLQLSDRAVETCQHNINNDTESWSFSIGEGKVNNIGYSNNAVANKPSPLNRDTILKILSTLKFTPQNQTISQADIDAIKQALLSVVKTTKENLIFDIDINLANQYNGMFASGHEGAKDAAGGGVWIAAKVNGAWQIISSGNGVSACAELNPYKVPSAFSKICVDASGKIVNR